MVRLLTLAVPALAYAWLIIGVAQTQAKDGSDVCTAIGDEAACGASAEGAFPVVAKTPKRSLAPP